MFDKLTSSLKAFFSDKAGAITIEYVTIAAIGSVIAIAVLYQIGGGDDGRSGVSGLVTSLSGELDAASGNIGGAVNEGS